MTVLTLDRLPTGTDAVAVPTVPEQRNAPELRVAAVAGTGTAATGVARRRLDPASIELRPAGTRSITLRV